MAYQYLYHDDDEVHLMHPETMEELDLPFSLFTGEKKHVPFLEGKLIRLDDFSSSAGMKVYVDTVEGSNPICFRLPTNYTYEVESVTAGGVQPNKGSRLFPAVLKNGSSIPVPDFVKPGDKVLVDLQELKYISRA
ncbi:hypothetical protein DSO57_1025986 [Entomophthora muscae]|uniref:Uncharacterized protein n=1 Tax=Entomophthora muscae TaxID=34485 RepID=A0ACC2UNV4_9FUNG|nr:hypothetical protein DSO57_1025986 [Entomophthora muscae]